jgi:hypothetical protein
MLDRTGLPEVEKKTMNRETIKFLKKQLKAVIISGR